MASTLQVLFGGTPADEVFYRTYASLEVEENREAMRDLLGARLSFHDPRPPELVRVYYLEPERKVRWNRSSSRVITVVIQSWFLRNSG